MLKHFKNFIDKENLFNPEDEILLAVSGGPDSVFLCELFHLAGYKFGIAHCNFQLRGKDSDLDELFVKQMAKRYNSPFYCKHFDTKKYASENNISIEMAARFLRYKWFYKLLDDENYKYIATGHHLDDQIETLFINFLRGTGIKGLHGILPKQHHILHPLLFTYRKDIEKFLLENNLSYRIDRTNKSLNIIRNKFRHSILPLLKEINPNYKNIITKNIERLREAELIYKTQINNKKNKVIQERDNKTFISIEQLKNLHPIRTYLFEFLAPYDFNFSVVENIIDSLNNISGKQFFSHSHRLIKDRNNLIITKRAETQHPNKMEVNVRDYFINENDSLIKEPVKLEIRKITNENYKIPKDKNTSSLDIDKLKFPLILRKWQKGDFFYPFGMYKKKKLSDYFIDQKFSLIDKENTWLLCSKNIIVWIVGQRPDNRFRITKYTKIVYQVKLIN